MTTILGISSFYHDSAAVLIKNGEILGAAQEERFTRIKNDFSFPVNVIKFLLKSNDQSLASIDKVIFYEKPFLKFERIVETYLAFAPQGFKSFRLAMPIWLKEKLFQKNIIIKNLKKIDKLFDSKKLMFAEHHLSHAASAFYPSPFEEAIILTIDGVGEWATTTVSIGKKNKIDIIKEIYFPHSLGLLYSAFTFYIGFKVNSGEYKLMGLAPYGQPKYKDLILDNIVDLKEDGSFRLNQKYFNYTTGLTMTNNNFSKLFGKKVRNPNHENIEQFHMDIASSVQAVIEKIVLKMTNSISSLYKVKNLCLAGGVALNCVLNSKILKEGSFKNIWVQPAAGDAGGALGAALLLWYNEMQNTRNIDNNDSMKGSYLGPEFDSKEIENSLIKIGANYKLLDNETIIKETVKALIEGKAIGWFQGRMEFGPRALGCRSIIADPRSDKMQKLLNLKIKYRESFRPFAPSVLREDVKSWFEFDIDSPYMLFVANVLDKHCIKMTKDNKKLFGIDKLNIKRSNIPAVTHVDYSARIQTVNNETNQKYYSLISEFKKQTGCPIIVNTSFNIRGEPIVCTPEDAFNCFMGTELNVLVIENFLLEKKDQNQFLKNKHKEKYGDD